ncbi:putative vitamin h protein [Phaeoacremonium minimum UCRPA7]|uniref:Putative vitamin h protein n=1 Tax=Phaeoacremonium minimum (strain UCR-PA7) TaxID=1286976 RepID=R8BP40_PHAM7|nr:putative vitamin h protein [Phaeoacremonium minimum UCRPA7]EOO01168.1 putative vitamin h protein [Phaeoacremonium minimum UCRPA7]
MAEPIEPRAVVVDPEAAEATRKQAEVKVSRAATVLLRDDPEARAAFLSTFTAEEEKSIMRKVELRFSVLIGLMYMIKQVRQNQFPFAKNSHDN